MKKVSIRKSPIAGKGLYTDELIRANEKILQARGPVVKKVTKSYKDSRSIQNWIGVDKDLWMMTEKTPLRYINHSCSPNAAMTGQKTLVALEDIPKDTELTIDYSMTDADPHWHITCKCGAKDCRKDIRAIYTVPPEVFKRHFPFVSKPFQRIFIQSYIQKKLDGKKSV